MSSVIISGDTSGSITLQAPAVSGATTLTLPAVSGTVLQSGTTVTEAQGGTGTTVGYNGFKNRIINGNMVINQRGSTVTTLNDSVNFFPVDRFSGGSLSDGAITSERSTDAPTGFTNSIKYTVTTADASLSAAQYARLYHQIEGFNVADFAWGSASAATVTLSFWTKSSVTGTFGGTIQNSARDRSYAFSYTIIAANTWEYETITIPGDTAGTWLKDNNVGLRIAFGLAAGSSYQQATTNTWQSTGVQLAPSTALNLLATNSATWYITGIQLEKGSTATSFDYRPYGTELDLCQRYFYAFPARSGGGLLWTTSFLSSTAYAIALIPRSMRALPTPTDATSGSSTVSSGAGNIYSSNGTSTNANTSSGSQPVLSTVGTPDSPVLIMSWSGASTPTTISNNFASASFNGGTPGILLNSEL